jgi:hypothetical protein
MIACGLNELSRMENMTFISCYEAHMLRDNEKTINFIGHNKPKP